MKKLIICFAFVAGLSACSQYPHIYLGDNSGELVYQSNNRSLHLKWVHASKVVQFSGDTLKIDTIR